MWHGEPDGKTNTLSASACLSCFDMAWQKWTELIFEFFSTLHASIRKMELHIGAPASGVLNRGHIVSISLLADILDVCLHINAVLFV